MAKINYRFKACHVEATKAEWEALKELMYSDEYTFPEYFILESNPEKLLPEYIVDLVEMKDFVCGMDEGESLKEQMRHLTAVAECLNIDVEVLAEYGLLQIYYEDE